MTETTADDADLLERSAAAATPEERAAVFGFDLAPMRRAARRLYIGGIVVLAVGAVAITFSQVPDTDDMNFASAGLGLALGFAAPVVTFVLAQIVVRLFTGSRMSAVAIATAPATTVLASLLMLGALALAPRDVSGFTGLLVGTWLSGVMDTTGNGAVARVFDRHMPLLPTTARWLHEYPDWASVARGRWVWLLIFAVVGALTSVGALLVFRDVPVATAPVIAALALGATVEAWATLRDKLAIRVLVSFGVLAGIAAVWIALR